MSNTTSASDPPRHDIYGYTPTLYVCVIFVALFGLSTLIHIGQAIRFRLWWLFPTAILAGFAEVLGWSGRLWSSQNPTLLTPYLMQITTTIIAPTPLVAANFIILGQIINRLGREYSRIGPQLYTIVFCSADIIALVIQSIGGASASHAAETNGDPTLGGHIMLGGIVFQMVAITVYVACAGEFLLRYIRDQPLRAVAAPGIVSPTATLVHAGESGALEKGGKRERLGRLDRGVRMMLAGLVFSTLVIFIRSIYRTIELSNGWKGRIIQTEVYFNVLDGAMITLAIFTLNFCHPGFLLKRK